MVGSCPFLLQIYGYILTLLSVVHQASWSSLYDVRADLTSTSASSKVSSAPTITLQYRANITQNTGEDWDGVILTLSTASPLLGSEIPVLGSWKIGPRPVVVPRYRGRERKPEPQPVFMVTPSMPPPPGGLGGPYGFAQPPGPGMMLSSVQQPMVYAESGPAIAVSEGAISSTFEIEGLSTIPSDNTSHKVSIAVSSSVQGYRHHPDTDCSCYFRALI